MIVSLDTTRADRLPAYGYMDVSMPHLDRLAREGVVFDQATSVAPLTLPAHASLFTGLYPPGHGVRDNADPALAEEHATLAETLRERGFRTAAFVGSVVVNPERGLAQGFDEYRGVATDKQAGHGPERMQRRADAVVTDALEWLGHQPASPFFLWVHLYDPHRPYDPPEPYRSSVADPYVGEIAFADSQIGRLLDALERRRLYDRTVVVVVGDHGESLGDHGERDHGIFVYESVMRVPFIVRAPGLAPRRVGAVVRLVDVMPTVLDLVGLQAPDLDGVSLVDLMKGSRRSDLEAYSESLYPRRFGWSPLLALRDGRFKLISAPRPELYDLERDPFEERNIYGERRELAEAMTTRLADIARERSTGTGTPAVPPDVQARLAALGYVGSVPTPAMLTGEQLPDPKDCIGRADRGHPRPSVGSDGPAGCGRAGQHAGSGDIPRPEPPF
ncbi:MAG TPA: sulfatase [Vicinamibacterales bacterium]|nr:sulfatase [Vicinamibacterales bacterium]